MKHTAYQDATRKDGVTLADLRSVLADFADDPRIPDHAAIRTVTLKFGTGEFQGEPGRIGILVEWTS